MFTCSWPCQRIILLFYILYKWLLYWSRSATVRSGTTQRFVAVDLLIFNILESTTNLFKIRLQKNKTNQQLLFLLFCFFATNEVELLVNNSTYLVDQYSAKRLHNFLIIYWIFIHNKTWQQNRINSIETRVKTTVPDIIFKVAKTLKRARRNILSHASIFMVSDSATTGGGVYVLELSRKNACSSAR